MKRAFVVLLVCALAASCGGSPPNEPRPTAIGSPTPRPRPLPPRAESSKDVDPVMHVGQQIFITDEGFRPSTLVAIVGEEVTWTNETDDTVEIGFKTGAFESGPIEPGGSVAFTSDNRQSIAYFLVGDPDVQGTLEVEPYFEHGEDPASEGRYDADTPAPID